MAVILDINAELAIIVSAAVAIFYTFLGGLYSVAYTDIIQFFFIAIGLVSALTASQPASSRLSLPHSLLRPVFHCLLAVFHCLLLSAVPCFSTGYHLVPGILCFCTCCSMFQYRVSFSAWHPVFLYLLFHVSVPGII